MSQSMDDLLCLKCGLPLDLWHGRSSGTYWVHHPASNCLDGAWAGKSWEHGATPSAAVDFFRADASSWSAPGVDFLQWFDRVVDLEIQVLKLKKTHPARYQAELKKLRSSDISA